ncbi:MAG TPA: cation:proton antiporter [Candidatus Limnocylindrales bacterium]|nr:cation:proton antiporter [Candidatus Limnocylindrales bacterium]
MRRVLIYSFLLVAGMVLSQLPIVQSSNAAIMPLTMIFLAYIMIEVGMEFDIDKSRLSSYAVDYAIAMAAAAVPWLCAAFYFWWFFSLGFKESLLVGRFSSPTSAGILFTMLAAAGLASTWVYKKARVLAIFDDLDTVLLMIPLKMMLIGFEPKLLILILAVFLFLAAAYFCIHWLAVPTGNAWIMIYAVLVWGVTYAFDYVTELHLEVLVPAFALGCVIKSDHLHGSAEYAGTDFRTSAPDWRAQAILDWTIKGGFMVLAGTALPPIQLGGMPGGIVLAHVILITCASNIGKCVPMLAYRDEVSLRERLALSIGMFPRGEVGIGVLLVSLDIFRQQNMLDSPAIRQSMTIAGLSLALNLALTGVFILAMIRLMGTPRLRPISGKSSERDHR